MKKLAAALLASTVMVGAAHAGEVKIGVVLGYTGPIESLTPDMAAGAELAMKEVNAAGGILSGDTFTSVRGDSTCVDAAAAQSAAAALDLQQDDQPQRRMDRPAQSQASSSCRAGQ